VNTMGRDIHFKWSIDRRNTLDFVLYNKDEANWGKMDVCTSNYVEMAWKALGLYLALRDKDE